MATVRVNTIIGSVVKDERDEASARGESTQRGNGFAEELGERVVQVVGHRGRVENRKGSEELHDAEDEQQAARGHEALRDAGDALLS